MSNAKKTDKIDRFFNKLRRRIASYPKKYPDIWEEGLKASIKNHPHRKKRSIAANIYAVGYVEGHLPYLRMLKNKSLLSNR